MLKADGSTPIRDLDQPVAQIFKIAVSQSMQRWQAGMMIDCKSHTMDANRVAKRPSDLSHLLALKHTATDPRDQDACALEWAGLS